MARPRRLDAKRRRRRVLPGASACGVRAFPFLTISFVTTGLDPVVYAEVPGPSLGGNGCASVGSEWIAGSSPAMTKRNLVSPLIFSRFRPLTTLRSPLFACYHAAFCARREKKGEG